MNLGSFIVGALSALYLSQKYDLPNIEELFNEVLEKIKNNTK